MVPHLKDDKNIRAMETTQAIQAIKEEGSSESSQLYLSSNFSYGAYDESYPGRHGRQQGPPHSMNGPPRNGYNPQSTYQPYGGSYDPMSNTRGPSSYGGQGYSDYRYGPPPNNPYAQHHYVSDLFLARFERLVSGQSLSRLSIIFSKSRRNQRHRGESNTCQGKDGTNLS